MELLELKLTRFAGFEELGLDLGQGGPGLYVVYGRNEAGKSTLRRALFKLLFGFDTRQDPDVRGRKRRETWVEARLRLAGDVLRVRRSAHGNALSGNRDDLHQLLAIGLRGLSREQFERIFCLGHQELREGGKEILSPGDNQRGLWFLASGVRNAEAVRKEIEEQIKALYTARSRERELDRLLSELEQAKEELRNFQVQSETWRKLEAELHEKKLELQRCRTRWRQIQRRKDALDNFAHRRELEKRIRDRERELAGLSGAEKLDETLFDRFRAAQERLDRAEEDLRRVDVELATRREHLARQEKKLKGDQELAQFCSFDPEAVDEVRSRLAILRDKEHERREAISGLRQGLRSLYQKTQRIVGERPPSLRSALERARHIARQLPERKVGELQRHWDRVYGQLVQLKEASAQIRADLDQIERGLAEVQQAPATEDLTRARILLRQAQQRYLSLCKSKDELGRLEEEIARAKRLLGASDLDDSVILTTPLPAESELRKLADRHNDLTEKLRHVAERIRELQEELQGLEAAVEADEEEGFAQLMPALEQAKARRDELWSELRRHIVDSPDKLMELPADRRAGLAADFEDATAEVDRLYDEILRNYEKLEQYRQRQRELRVRRRKLEEKTAEQTQWQTQLAECEEQFATAWGKLFVGQSPGKAEEWLENVRELQSKFEARDKLRKEAEQQELELRAVVQELLEAVGQTLEAGQDLGAILDQLPEMLASLEQTAQKRDKLAQDRSRRQRDLSESGERLHKLEENRLAVAQLLGAAIGRQPAPEEVDMVLAELKELFVELASIDEQVESLREYRRCHRDLQVALSSRCGVRLSGRRLVEYTQRLDRRYEEALRLLKATAEDAEMVNSLNEELERAKLSRDSARRERDAVLAQLGCRTPSEVWELQRRVTRAKSLVAEIEQDRMRLEALPEIDLREFSELEGGDSDTAIEALRRELEEELHKLESVREELVREEQECMRQLKDLQERDARALAAARRCEELFARVRARFYRYLVLKAAHRLVERAIQVHQHRAGPALEQRASEFFAVLTGNRYRGFQFDAAHGGEIRILRSNGGELDTEELSDGTADQLFLALRLAVIERFLSEGGPVPVVLDDVLVHFDDERARYGLEALAAIGKQTQVLLFTHHSRIVDLAGGIPGTVVTDAL